MKKFLMLTATTICMAMTACTPTSSPNGTTNPGGTTIGAGGTVATGGNLTKAQYVAFLQCYASKKPEPYATSFKNASVNADALSDSKWAELSATYTENYKSVVLQDPLAQGCKI